MKKREQILLGACGIVVAGAVWFVLLPPDVVGKTNLVPLEQARTKTKESKANAQRLREEQAAIEPQIKARAYDKPADQLVALLVGSLQASAERAGIHLREVRPKRNQL